MKKKIFIALGIFYFIFMILMFASMNNDDKNANILTKLKYGEKYPYTIDNMELKCSGHAVWVETQTGEKYALNGLAKDLLKNDSLYKGDTNQILIPNKSDLSFLEKGFNCNQTGK